MKGLENFRGMDFFSWWASIWPWRNERNEIKSNFAFFGSLFGSFFCVWQRWVRPKEYHKSWTMSHVFFNSGRKWEAEQTQQRLKKNTKRTSNREKETRVEKKMFTFKFDSSKKEEANKFCSAREENEREHSTCFFLYGLCQQKLSTVFFRIGENRKKVLRDNQKTHKRKWKKNHSLWHLWKVFFLLHKEHQKAHKNKKKHQTAPDVTLFFFLL